MQTSRLLSFSSNSTSFGSFSSAVDLAAIAARVVEEFRDQEQRSDSHRDDNDNDNEEDDVEFAFDCPSRRCSHPIATADEIFCNGQIRPSNPYGGGAGNAPVDGKNGGESQPLPSPPTSTLPRRHRPALRKLMSEEQDPTSNPSSEADEDLTGVPPETYCVWTPKQASNVDRDSRDDDLQGLSSSPSQSKIKSNSAGFSKRWKLRNLLYARSSSEGNEKLVFPVSVKKSDVTNSDHREEEEEPPSKVVVGEEENESEEAKRQSFVPYRKDMMGILKNVNGLSRHLRPF